jgi:hypothetical protein
MLWCILLKLIFLLQNFNLELFSPECTANLQSFWDKYILKMMIPFIIGLILLILAAIEAFRKPVSQRTFSSWSEFLFQQGVTLLLLAVGTLYTFLLVATLGPFKCIKAENNYVLWDYPSLRCFDTTWYSWLPLVVFFTLLYGVFLPGVLVLLLFKQRSRIGDASFQLLFGNFTKPFKKEYFWWGLVFIMKRSSFALTGAFMKMKNVEGLSVFITFLIWSIFLWAENRFNPFC